RPGRGAGMAGPGAGGAVRASGEPDRAAAPWGWQRAHAPANRVRTVGYGERRRGGDPRSGGANRGLTDPGKDVDQRAATYLPPGDLEPVARAARTARASGKHRECDSVTGSSGPSLSVCWLSPPPGYRRRRRGRGPNARY